MNREKIPRSPVNRICILLLVFFILFGGNIHLSFLESVFVFPVSVYRLGVSAMTLFFLCRRFLCKKAAYPFSRLFLVFAGVMVFWLLYGAAASFLSPYTTVYDGFGTLFSVFQGLCCVYCLYECLGDRAEVDFFLGILRAVCVLLLVAGMAECLTGLHGSQSELTSVGAVTVDGRTYLPGLHWDCLFIVRSLSFNENNFGAMLAVLLPTLFVTRELPWWRAALRYLGLLAALYILAVDDANIVILGVIASALVWAALRYRDWLSGGLTLALTAAVQGGLAGRISTLLLKLKHALWGGRISAEELLRRAGRVLPDANACGVSASLSSPAQVVAADISRGGHGALRTRWDICLDDLDMFFGTHGLGSGPAGYQHYYETHAARTPFINPHCWWLEILSQYGIFVFLAYVGALVYLFVQVLRAWLQDRQTVYATALAMCTAFVLACIAPSSYIGTPYQWLLPALCLALLRIRGAEKVPA